MLSDSGLGWKCAVHSDEVRELDLIGFLGIRNDKADSLRECVITVGGYGRSSKLSDGSNRSSGAKCGSIGER